MEAIIIHVFVALGFYEVGLLLWVLVSVHNIGFFRKIAERERERCVYIYIYMRNFLCIYIYTHTACSSGETRVRKEDAHNLLAPCRGVSQN